MRRGGQATEAERTELDGLVARQPGLKAKFESVQADVRLAREVFPLVSATEATAPELPAYARGRLQTKVRQTLGRPETRPSSASDKERGLMWRWRWLIGLATAVGMVILLAVLWPAPAPVIQVAMLDAAAASRGSDAKELAGLRQT